LTGRRRNLRRSSATALSSAVGSGLVRADLDLRASVPSVCCNRPRPSHVRLSANRVRRTTQTPFSAIAMLQPTFDSTWNADAAERFLRRLGPVGLDSEKSVGGGYNRVRPPVGGLPGGLIGGCLAGAYRRKIRRRTHLRRSSLRRYSDLVDICCNKCVSIDASNLHLTPYHMGS
jgi:hypothetical protein